MIYSLDDLPVYSLCKRRIADGDEGMTAAVWLSALGDKTQTRDV